MTTSLYILSSSLVSAFVFRGVLLRGRRNHGAEKVFGLAQAYCLSIESDFSVRMPNEWERDRERGTLSQSLCLAFQAVYEFTGIISIIT